MPACTPRMAAQQSARGQPDALERAMRGDGFARIQRAAWIEAAVLADQRAQQKTVDIDRADHHDAELASELRCAAV